jgi:AraC-like DNA-binding protein
MAALASPDLRGTPPTTVARHASALGRWEIAHRLPPPALRAHVQRYTGWVESTPVPMRRRELPVGAVPVIVSFGPPFDLLDPAIGRRTRRVSFVAGLDDRYTVVEHAGESRGVQIYFTPLGARRFFGQPLRDLAYEVVELEDVLGVAAMRELTDRLACLPGWEERFELLDAVVLDRLARAAAPPGALQWAWRRLEETDGGVAVGALAAEVGWSRRHLVAQVREQLGLPPKTLARVLRFQRAVERLARDDGSRLAEIALDCGYYDQAHFNRDFRAFAGDAPTAFLARRLPAGAGYAD